MLPLTFPAIPGHEVIGDVVAAHPSVKGFQVGDRVGAPWQRGYCGKCANCVAGQLMGCDKAMFYNTGERRSICDRVVSAHMRSN